MKNQDSKNNKTNGQTVTRTEAYDLTHREEIDTFLNNNGYTAREVRGIARNAILLWETQKT